MTDRLGHIFIFHTAVLLIMHIILIIFMVITHRHRMVDRGNLPQRSLEGHSVAGSLYTLWNPALLFFPLDTLGRKLTGNCLNLIALGVRSLYYFSESAYSPLMVWAQGGSEEARFIVWRGMCVHIVNADGARLPSALLGEGSWVPQSK